MLWETPKKLWLGNISSYPRVPRSSGSYTWKEILTPVKLGGLVYTFSCFQDLINFHFQTWVFWEWLHCETRALFFSICRGGVTFPAVSDGPNSVRCWMLCSVCWNVHWESQPHTTVSSEQLTAVWCLLRWKKATTVLFIFPSTSSGVGLWDGGQMKQLYSILEDADEFL